MTGVPPLPVAIVLGAAVRPDGSASPTLRLRVLHAVALWRAGRVGGLVMTGGQGDHGPPESHVARDLALGEGVPGDLITVEDLSTNTVGNLRHARAVLPPGARVAIVSSRWHLPRAWAAARVMGLDPVFASGPVGTASHSRLAVSVLREAAGLPLTLLRAARAR